jgi:hypothetical protein
MFIQLYLMGMKTREQMCLCAYMYLYKRVQTVVNAGLRAVVSTPSGGQSTPSSVH